LLKEIVIAIESYINAHRFIRKHNLWKWIIIPGILYALLFLIGMYFFWTSSGDAVSYLSNRLGIDRWLSRKESGLLSFLFMMSQIMIRFIMLIFWFSLFKFLFLIIGSPIFAYLSEKTASIIEGKDFPFSLSQLFRDMWRGIKLALRNTVWQTLFTISTLLASLIPVAGWITPIIMVFIECYYYGFSMLDYSCERNKLSPKESIEFIGRHKGLAIGNGIMFYGLHFIPFIGWVFAPAYAVIAATLSLYEHKEVRYKINQ
jgi:CysZ protein